MKILSNRLFIYFLSIFVAGYLVYAFWPKQNNIDRFEVAGVPLTLVKKISSSEVDYSYESTAISLSDKRSYHENLGKRLYHEAMGDKFYSAQKLQLLKASKMHLLLAKRLRD